MKNTLIAVAVFSIAFAFVEAAVVVYLRLHFYPGGFSFPLVEIPSGTGLVEIAREIATIVMLGVVGLIAARRPLARYAFSAFAFGVWDIFYYVWLKFILDWPVSLLTWDVLFLIPLPWLGPVLAPVIVSLCLIVSSVIILQRESTGRPLTIRAPQWFVAASGGVLVLASFLGNLSAMTQPEHTASFNWLLFVAGIGTGITGFVWALRNRA